jgi:molybdate transport system permease protein
VRPGWFTLSLIGALACALVFLTLPIAAIFLEISPRDLVASLDNEAALDALRLSLITTAIALALIVAFGTPAAYFLATRPAFRGRDAIITAIELPLVLPPPVAGVGLLVAFGPEGLIGGALDDAGVGLVFETAGVVAALTFVASPFYLRQTQVAFEGVDRELIETARDLGASEARAFVLVAVPLARAGMFAGAAVAWGRALGEFGATLVFAGSFQGITQTAPLAIVELFGTDFEAALALSAVLVAISAALLATVRLAGIRLLAPEAR